MYRNHKFTQYNNNGAFNTSMHATSTLPTTLHLQLKVVVMPSLWNTMFYFYKFSQAGGLQDQDQDQIYSGCKQTASWRKWIQPNMTLNTPSVIF